MVFSLPRGMRDLIPEDYSVLERIREAFVETSRLFGFRVMEPSPIELLTTLEAKGGSGIRNEIYCFKDKSGRDVGLRFDLTVGITRYITSRRGLQLPVKIGAFSGMWRYDEPQYGRYRWFYQWDAEIFGPTNIESDAEIIEFTNILFDTLGLKDSVIRIGDRRLMEEFVKRRLGIIDEDTIIEMLRAVDKIGKKTIPEIIQEYERKGVRKETVEKLIDIGRIKGDFRRVLKELEDHKLERTDGLGAISEELKARHIRNFSLDLGVVRGLDYYTGIVFEVYGREDEKLGALAGGGRFDILPRIFGRPDMGATGVAGGVERMMLAISRQHLKKIRSNTFVYVGYVNKKLAREASEVASELRRKAIPTVIELLGRSLNRQLEVASAEKIPFFVIVAPREYSQEKAVLRDMLRGTEETIQLGRLAATLGQRMKDYS